MTRFLWIGLGGALGTWTRYLISLGAARLLGASFPFGTLLVNVTGCFLIAFIMQLAASTDLISTTMRLTLTTGFMGGLTTYSTFNYETTRYLQEHAPATAWANFGATVVGCFVAGLLGLASANRLFHHP